MKDNLRQLIITKCRAIGISIEHLAQVADCSIIELKGFEQGLFLLGTDKVARLIKVLGITEDELIAAVGHEAAKTLIKKRHSNLA